MTALTPHIRVLRAEAEALLEQAVELRRGEHFDAAFVVLSIGHAKCHVADALEAEERAQPLSGPQPKGH